MFICKECADKNWNIDSFWFIVGPLSKGPCEDCGITKVCLDAHNPQPKKDDPNIKPLSNHQ